MYYRTPVGSEIIRKSNIHHFSKSKIFKIYSLSALYINIKNYLLPQKIKFQTWIQTRFPNDEVKLLMSQITK